MAEAEVKDTKYKYEDSGSLYDPFLDGEKVDDPEQSERVMQRKAERAKKAEKQSPDARKKRRRISFAAAALFLAVAFAVVGLAKSLLQLSELTAEKAQMQSRLDELNRQIELNKATLEQVNSDEYVEQQARSQYRMIKDGEVLYIVEGGYVDPDKEEENATPEDNGTDENETEEETDNGSETGN